MANGEVINLSISGLLQQVFGVKLAVFKPDIEPLPARADNNSLGTAYYGVDQFGREVFLPITINYTDENGNKQEVVLSHAIIGINDAVRDIETQLTERAGSFTETASNDEWNFEIMGFIIEGTNDFPEDQFKQLVALKKYNGVVHFKNAMTDHILLGSDSKGYDTVRIKSIDFPPVRGIKSAKPYSLRIKQDIPFNLYEIK